MLTILGIGTFALVRFDPAQTAVLLTAAGGVLFLALGSTAHRHPERFRLVLLVSIGLAVLMIILGAGGFIDVYRMLRGASLPYPTIALEQGVTVILCSLFLVRATFALAETFNKVEA